jgi:hypothetical protein
MQINDRNALVSETITRVLNHAPVSEVLRVYSLAIQHELEKLSDEELTAAIQNAGYLDLVEKYTEGAETEGDE